MGILLVGVVGALFFRNEPLDVGKALDARRENDLNQKLNDRDVALYADSHEVSSEESPNDAHQRLDQILKSQQKPTPNRTVTGLVKERTQHRDSVDNEVHGNPLSFEPPEKPAGQEKSTVQKKSPVTAQTADEELSLLAPELRGANNTKTLQRDEFEEYKVQFGDTLSGIAERFLGAQSRYREIYEANRDRMKSPDQLKVGSSLRIPRVVH